MADLSAPQLLIAKWRGESERVRNDPECFLNPRLEGYTETMDECAAELEAAMQAQQGAEPVAWQPIETAPKEVDVIVYCFGAAIPQRIAMLCPQDEERYAWVDTSCNTLGLFPPTHWQPLPTAPATGAPR